jgi:hypothetical protein
LSESSKAKRLYYFTPEHHAIENIERARIKTSIANDVNDAFELKPFRFEGQTRETRRVLRQMWQKHIEDFFCKFFSFISFSENWASPAMWGQYANNHKGVCYGFDVYGEPTKIHYSKELRSFTSVTLKDKATTSETMEYSKRTKSIHWKYEKEWRLYLPLLQCTSETIANGKTAYFQEFSPKLDLKEVIIGAKSDLSSKQIIDAIGARSEVSIITARPSFRKYKMVEQKEDCLKK